MDTNARRYMRQFIPAMIAYSIVLVAAMWLLVDWPMAACGASPWPCCP